MYLYACRGSGDLSDRIAATLNKPLKGPIGVKPRPRGRGFLIAPSHARSPLGGDDDANGVLQHRLAESYEASERRFSTQ